MIEDYHRTAQGLLLDPTTGKPLAQKYHPSQVQVDVADLQTLPPIVDFAPAGRPAEKADIDHYEGLILVLKSDLEKEKMEYSILYEKLLKEKDILNTTPISPSVGAQANQPAVISDLEAEIRRKILADITANEDLMKHALENIKENKSMIITHDFQLKRDLEAHCHSLMAQTPKD